jgi:hypothetical protein
MPLTPPNSRPPDHPGPSRPVDPARVRPATITLGPGPNAIHRWPLMVLERSAHGGDPMPSRRAAVPLLRHRTVRFTLKPPRSCPQCGSIVWHGPIDYGEGFLTPARCYRCPACGHVVYQAAQAEDLVTGGRPARYGAAIGSWATPSALSRASARRVGRAPVAIGSVGFGPWVVSAEAVVGNGKPLFPFSVPVLPQPPMCSRHSVVCPRRTLELYW